MAKAQSIAPFPSGIDRQRFGDYLSGFSDGEACFNLYFTSHGTPGATFTVGLRQDDNGVLYLIQSFFGCGRVYLNSRIDKGKEIFAAQYSIYVVADLASVIVPHFEQFPMFAKKVRDYHLWKQGVALIMEGRSRRRVRNGNGVFDRHWAPAEIERFNSLFESLRSLREFNASTGRRSTYNG